MAYKKLSDVEVSTEFDTLLSVSGGVVKQVSDNDIKSHYNIDNIEQDIINIDNNIKNMQSNISNNTNKANDNSDRITSLAESVYYNSKIKSNGVIQSINAITPVGDDCSDGFIRNLKILGKTIQTSEPSPTSPASFSHAGTKGNITVDIYKQNLVNMVGSSFISNSGVVITVAEDGLVSAVGTAVYSGGRTNSNCSLTLYPGVYITRMFDAYKNLSSDNVLDGAFLTNSINGQIIALVSNGTFTIEETATFTLGFNVVLDTEYNDEFYLCIYPINADLGVGLEYNKQTISVTTNGLRATPLTDESHSTYMDSNGLLWCADEIDLENKKYIKRVGSIVLTGNETIADYRPDDNTDSYLGFNIPIPTESISNGKIGDMQRSTHFTPGSATTAGYYPNVFLVHPNASNLYIRAEIEGVTDKDSFKSWLATQYQNGTPVEFVYALKTPIVEDIEVPEEYLSLHSNYPITSVINDEGTNIVFEYNADIKSYIDKKFEELAASIS